MSTKDDSAGPSPHALVTDAKPAGEDGSNEASPPMTRKIKYDHSSMEYDMSGDRLMYIFNHEEYEESEFYKRFPPLHRIGTEFDMERLNKTFSKLKFKIDPCQDFTRAQIFAKLKEISNMDHSNTSCVAIVILTHGSDGGKVYATDQPYGLLDVFEYVMHEPRLAGKPKLFFIQACTGDRKDKGHWDSNQEEIEEKPACFTIPTYSDCLVMLAAYYGFGAYRNSEKGSWMIQALCDVLDEHHKEEDILHMVTLVNDLVADMTEIRRGGKQIPDTSYTLTKLLEL